MVHANDSSLTALPRRLESDWLELDFPDEIADGAVYARGMHRRPLSYYVQRIDQLGFGGDRILDAGCGTGTWSFALRARAQQVHGVDKSADRIAVANWIRDSYDVDGVSFEVGDLLDVDPGDQPFDALFCYSVVISYLSAQETFAAFRRQMREGGTLYVCLNGLGWLYYLRDQRGAADEKMAEKGRQGIYKTFWERTIGPWPAEPSADAAELAPGVEAGDADSIAALAGRIDRPLEDLRQRVEAECGPAYLQTLYGDLAKCAAGQTTGHSYASAARGYDPEELRRVLAASGFEMLDWADEGFLGATDESAVKPIYPGRVNGELKVWEFLARAV